VAATVGGSQEDEVLVSHETAGPSSQRFSVETLRDEAGNFDDEIEVVISSGVENVLRVEQDVTVVGEKGASKVVVPVAKAKK
jgi:hypothetical protein